MILENSRGKIEIEICDNCFAISKIVGISKTSLELCGTCFDRSDAMIKKYDCLKRLKWYEILFQYQEKGYKLVNFG